MPPPLSNTHLRTPKGLEELLSYLTREILRSQPLNIYELCLTICQQLINERNNGILSHELIHLQSISFCHENEIELEKNVISIHTDNDKHEKEINEI